MFYKLLWFGLGSNCTLWIVDIGCWAATLLWSELGEFYIHIEDFVVWLDTIIDVVSGYVFPYTILSSASQCEPPDSLSSLSFLPVVFIYYPG